ncbi:MAG TPA: four helix bundle protein [Candidatus Magasanikbacteria bacterium]|nr:MAG: hypothetical protein A3I74_01110 [Candidatus Magasanikbacteria bacterium RIFCSPLOWO2_02_FULL_47_16]OGH79957.1 MAG: hypothetical protein A3C10_02115 [Candidatus Magasanikbacteria bacterium RIFCSPHIGHO2_02_FULL_48_18]OGH82969.1 MAG: hypothetical protein A3G08_03600 [Candidatus Magasanikbacteria bacterium RIFCSPLOWO2_12_FULL_47_9b]HAZ28568.1 four helix bundle protein [Candidatus Magasanikbacteria bacterium]
MQRRAYQKFYEMDIWKEAFGLQKEIFLLTQKFPKGELYGLISQLHNSCNSIPANIAESHGRYYYADKIRVLYTVRGEIEETQSHLMVAESRLYISQNDSERLTQKYESLKVRINNYISDLRERKNKEN